MIFWVKPNGKVTEDVENGKCRKVKLERVKYVMCTAPQCTRGMICEWNGPEWTTHYESCRSQQHFEYRHGYVREKAWKVMKDLRLWTSDGMDD